MKLANVNVNCSECRTLPELEFIISYNYSLNLASILAAKGSKSFEKRYLALKIAIFFRIFRIFETMSTNVFN